MILFLPNVVQECANCKQRPFCCKKMYVICTVMPLVGGQGGLYPTRNLGVQFTLFQPGGADYTHHITACPPEYENLAASLMYICDIIQSLPTLILTIGKKCCGLCCRAACITRNFFKLKTRGL